jgi:pimeloyl-ACP methyl ester carboxylesterase
MSIERLSSPDRSRRRRGLLTLTAAAGAVVLTATTFPAAAQARPAGTALALPAAVPAPSASPFEQQKLEWQPCFPDGSPILAEIPAAKALQCTSFAAPLDWRRPTAHPPIQIAVSKLPASAQPAAGVLFTNPGGPGGPGLFMPLSLLVKNRTAILSSQDVYGIDPRGTGASTNATCGQLDAQLPDVRSRSRAALNLLLDYAQLQARLCQARGGTLLTHINTPNTVRDLDLLRRLVGRSTINWWGVSGGTWMGAQYATTFPKRTGRFVLDSAAEFTAPLQRTWNPNQAPAFERRFRVDFLPWVARHDKVFRLGNTPEKVRSVYERGRALLAARPLDLGDKVIDGNTVDATLWGHLYSKQSFQAGAQVLLELKTLLGTASPARKAEARKDLARQTRRAAAAPWAPPLGAPISPDAETATFYGVRCNDTPWTGSRSSLINESRKLGARYPLRGYALILEPCVFWKRPPLTLPKVTGKGLPPMLVLQSVNDPATLYEGAVRATKATRGARLLTVTNEGDHGVYAGDNECVNRVVEKFLTTGVLPRAGATCRGVGIPAPTPAAPALAQLNPQDVTERLAGLARK